MFGIGGTELIVIAVVLLIAVGPNKLPQLLKAVVKGYREFRRATRELRASTGIDSIATTVRNLRCPMETPRGSSTRRTSALVNCRAIRRTT